MKPLKLKFRGIKSFSAWAEIDFERLLSSGIFGIFGDTGAGKSTILDCIGFVLYGKVNCIGKDGTTMSDILNFHSDKGEVEFDFEAECNGRRARYRIERTISKKGLQKATLYEQIEDKTVAIAEGASAVNKKVEEEIVGIGFDDFKKCIALPQGEFSEFLRSGRKDRLDLISKLFSLDEYGYALTTKVKKRMAVAEAERNNLEGKLSYYGDVSAEAIEAEEQTKSLLQVALNEKEEVAKQADKKVQEMEKAVRLQDRLQTAQKELADLELRREQMERLRDMIGRLRTAELLTEIQKECNTQRSKYQTCIQNLENFSAKENALKGKIEALNSDMGAIDYESKIEEAQEKLNRRQAVQGEFDRLKALDSELKKIRVQYKEAQDACKAYIGFDPEAEKKKLQTEAENLPQEDNYFDYIENNVKSVLLQKEYITFASELKSLTAKYPIIEKDTAHMIEKYLHVGKQGATVDIAAQMEYFKKASKRKQEIVQELSKIAVKEVEFRNALAEESRLKEEGVKLRQEFNDLNDRLKEIAALGEVAEFTKKLNGLKAEKKQKEGELEKDKEQLAKLSTSISAEQAKRDGYAEAEQKNRERLSQECAKAGVKDAQEGEELLQKYGSSKDADEKTKGFFLDYAQAKTKLESLQGETDEGTMSVTKEQLEEEQTKLTELQTMVRNLHGELTLCKNNVDKLREDLAKKMQLEGEMQKVTHALSMLQKLLDLVGRDKFMEFIAVEYLQDVASGANNLLTRLTGGRYFLTYGEKNFEVGDNYNGGQTRGIHTLSGGEVFLVSLSLALSLSEMIHRKSLRPIEFFFLDEGFGTLDDELVDTVMDSLEKLKSEHFSIGVISHVGELKNRLENKIVVKKASEESSSSIEIY